MLAIHVLDRRPGAMRRTSRIVAAPAELVRGGVVGVPEGADLELDVRLESVLEGVLASGSARARTTGECVRCLDPIVGDVEAEFRELFGYPDRVLDEEDTASELLVDGDLIDLEQAVRDAVVLALPQAPLCRDDCPGLCSQCGARLADDPRHAHSTTDPRWAARAGLLAGSVNNSDQENETGSERAVATEEN